MFLLLKLALFLFRPLIWIIVAFIIAGFTKNEKRKKQFFRGGLIALLVFTNPLLIRLVMQAYEPAPVDLKPAEQYAAGIVLGGFVSYNMKDDRGYFNPASDRFIQTALLYKTGHIRKIIIPAGNGYIVRHGFKEADIIREHFVMLGIAAEDIYVDTGSRNTLENAQNTRKLLDSIKMNGPFLLISSALHLPRAQKVFTKEGIVNRLYPCDFISKGRSNNFLEDDVLPSSMALRDWDSYIKEILGTLAYRLTGKV